MKNQKGFTLIELLAVIVILAVIALIATPVVMNSIEEARRGSARNTAYGVVKSVEHDIAIRVLEEPDFQIHGEENADIYNYEGIEEFDDSFDIQGTIPSILRLEFTNNEISGGGMCIDEYSAALQSGGDFRVDHEDDDDYCETP